MNPSAVSQVANSLLLFTLLPPKPPLVYPNIPSSIGFFNLLIAIALTL